MKIHKALTGLLAAAAGVLQALLLPATTANAEEVTYYPQTVVNASGTSVGEARFNWLDSGMRQVTDYAAPVTFTYSIDFLNNSKQSYTVKNISVGNSAHVYSEPDGAKTTWDQPTNVTVSAQQLTVPAGGTMSVDLTVSYDRPNVMRLNSYGGVSGFGYVVDASYTDASGTPQTFTVYLAVGSAVPWNPNANSYGQNQSSEALNQFLYTSCPEDDAHTSITVCGTWMQLGTGVFGSFQWGAAPGSGVTLPPGVSPSPPNDDLFLITGSSTLGEVDRGQGVKRIAERSTTDDDFAPVEGTSNEGQVCLAPEAPVAAVLVTLLTVLLLGVFTLIWFEHRKQLRLDARAAGGSVKRLTIFQIEALWNKLNGERV